MSFKYNVIPTNQNSEDVNNLPTVLDGKFNRDDTNFLLASIVDNLNAIIQNFCPKVTWLKGCAVQCSGTEVIVYPGLVWIGGLVYVNKQHIRLPDDGAYVILVSESGIVRYLPMSINNPDDESFCRLAIISSGAVTISRPVVSVVNYMQEGDMTLE